MVMTDYKSRIFNANARRDFSELGRLIYAACRDVRLTPADREQLLAVAFPEFYVCRIKYYSCEGC